MKFKTKAKLLNSGHLLASFLFLYVTFLAYEQQNYLVMLVGITASIVSTIFWYKINKALNSIVDK